MAESSKSFFKLDRVQSGSGTPTPDPSHDSGESLGSEDTFSDDWLSRSVSEDDECSLVSHLKQNPGAYRCEESISDSFEMDKNNEDRSGSNPLCELRSNAVKGSNTLSSISVPAQMERTNVIREGYHDHNDNGSLHGLCVDNNKSFSMSAGSSGLCVGAITSNSAVGQQVHMQSTVSTTTGLPRAFATTKSTSAQPKDQTDEEVQQFPTSGRHGMLYSSYIIDCKNYCDAIPKYGF